MRRPSLILLLILTTACLYAQQAPQVAVRAQVYQGTICLRWAVNTPLAWQRANQYGFVVERYTVVRDGQMLGQPEKVLLTPTPLKAQPLDNWETLAKANPYAAVVAQALYGRDFNLTGDDAKGVSKMMALAQQLEQRHLLSLYAADLCYPAALMAGWALEDNTAKPGERYLYRVTAAIPAKTMTVEQGSAYVSLADESPLPLPQELTAIFGDRSVLLAWDYAALSNTYNAYHLERSVDGKNFRRLSELPLVNLNSREGKSADRMFYTDSLQDNSTMVYYRVVGVTAFGQEGPASEVVKGSGQHRLIYVPHITRALPDDTGNQVTLDWEFDPRGEVQITGFELQRADQAKGPYVAVKKNISPTTRRIVFDSLQSSNYLVIAAVAKAGEPMPSFPVLVQPTDTIPPATPKGLTGLIDSAGVVRLSWKPSPDRDVLGYRIYRAQHDREEMIPLNDKAITATSWIDTISVKSLNSQVYYAVAALDQRYNQSDKSEVVALRKPEVVPPSAPVIVQYEIKGKAIVLTWATGGEDNLAAVQVYRALRGGTPTLIHTATDLRQHTFRDSVLQADAYYSYTLYAVSQGGLKSFPSPNVTIQAPATVAQAGGITAFTAKINRRTQHLDITWKHSLPDVKQFELYRNEDGKGFRLMKTVKGFDTKTEDETIAAGKTYEYMLRAILPAGRQGAVAKTGPIKVK